MLIIGFLVFIFGLFLAYTGGGMMGRGEGAGLPVAVIGVILGATGGWIIGGAI